MKSAIQGMVYYLDRPNIDTDQIIPAKYLTGVSISGLGSHLFENLDLQGFNREDPRFKDTTILVTGDNFGCGSSREHAVWALEDEGFQVVIAPSFARIFRQNMFSRGLLAIELPAEQVAKIFASHWENCQVNLEKTTLRFWSGEDQETGHTYNFQLADFDKSLVLQGGLVGFVARNY